MTATELLELGFKKKKLDSFYWFELNKGKHQFITNDNGYNNGKDKWIIGYYNKKNGSETCWFNQNLKTLEDFKVIYNVLVKTRINEK